MITLPRFKENAHTAHSIQTSTIVDTFLSTQNPSLYTYAHIPILHYYLPALLLRYTTQTNAIPYIHKTRLRIDHDTHTNANTEENSRKLLFTCLKPFLTAVILIMLILKATELQ